MVNFMKYRVRVGPKWPWLGNGEMPWKKRGTTFEANCSRFKIISTGPPIVLNETPFHDSSGTDSSLDSPMDQDSPLPHMLRPIRSKTAKAKRGSTSNNECAQC
ncbi:unnamed protein product [Prunus brigantina]